MVQISFGDAEFAKQEESHARELFLADIEKVVPWRELVKLLEPFYCTGSVAAVLTPLQTILRVHLMQNWLRPSDPATKEALYKIASMRAFA